MVTTKRCAYGPCRIDSRYLQSWKRNENGVSVTFFRFRGVVRLNERRHGWITACHRSDSFVCTKDSYICRIQFVGENEQIVREPCCRGDKNWPLIEVGLYLHYACLPFDSLCVLFFSLQ